MSLTLRPWQDTALNKALNWFNSNKSNNNNKFLINAAPGSGKTICASVIAKKLLDNKSIDRVIIIAPRREVVKQWKNEFKTVTGRSMLIITGKNEDVGLDVCATWNALGENPGLCQTLCEKEKVLVICDEHHHASAAVDAVWGTSASRAFEKAKFVLVLTGTPIRTDGNSPVWFQYSKAQEKDLTHPQEGTYTLTYGEAVDLKYCRPAFFHRHEGKFSVQLTKGGETLAVSGQDGIKIDKKKYNDKVVKALQKSLDFIHLAKSPDDKYVESGGEVVDTNSYQASMLNFGIAKLNETKERLPKAAGLVIAPNIKVAEYMAKLLKELTGEAPFLVHSNKKNSEDLIEAFRESDKDWIVSVAMITEGVDIKRLRLLIYLPNAETELAFRQALGRVVRSMGDKDDSSAYVIMPVHKVFEEFARRVESEMKPIYLKEENERKKTKVCPKCEKENSRKNLECDYCGYEFPQRKMKMKNCEKCDHENPDYLDNCQSCGEKFKREFTLVLNTALRMGGIAREMDVDEAGAKNAEQYYKEYRQKFLDSGDTRIINLLSVFPKESLAKLIKIAKDISKE